MTSMHSGSGNQAFKSSGGPWGSGQAKAEPAKAPKSYDKQYPAASAGKKSGAATAKEEKKSKKAAQRAVETESSDEYGEEFVNMPKTRQ